MSTKTRDTAWYSYTSSTQTMRTWARRLKSYEDVPQEFLSAFPEYESSFPYTVLIPEDNFTLFHKRNEKILCVYDDRFILLEASRNQVKTHSCRFDEVLYLEQGRILLHSWLKIKVPSETLFIRFNTTNLRWFEPVIKSIRRGLSTSHCENGEHTRHKQELAKFDYLNTLKYKYMNFGRQSIYPGQTVLTRVYQPERCIQQGVSLFKKTLFKRYATSHLSILTEQELILIKENKHTKPEKTNLYGGVFSYIPRHQIQGIGFTPDPENSCCTMDLCLAEDTHLSSDFSLDNDELKVFQRDCQEMYSMNQTSWMKHYRK